MSTAKVTRKSVLARLTEVLGEENCAEKEERKVSFEEAELETQQRGEADSDSSTVEKVRAVISRFGLMEYFR